MTLDPGSSKPLLPSRNSTPQSYSFEPNARAQLTRAGTEPEPWKGVPRSTRNSSTSPSSTGRNPRNRNPPSLRSTRMQVSRSRLPPRTRISVNLESFEEAPLVWTAVRLHTLSHILPFTPDSGRTSDGTSTHSESGAILCTQRIVWKRRGCTLESPDSKPKPSELAMLCLGISVPPAAKSGRQLSEGFLWLQESA